MSVNIFKINDFSETSHKKHNENRLSLSQESIIIRLKNDKYEYEKNSLWLLKSNQLDWIVNEYAATQAYKLILGEDNISDAVLVKDNKLTTTKLAIKLHDNYKHEFIPIGAIEGSYTNDRTCIVDKACNQFRGHEIVGFEKALLASEIFKDNDITDFNNFALKVYDDSVVVTRYDFDDSFSFLVTDGITKGITEAQINNRTKNAIKSKGYEISTVVKSLNSLYKPVYIIMSNLLKAIGDDSEKLAKKIEVRKLLDALDDVLRVNKSALKDVLVKSCKDAEEVVGSEVLAKHYDIKKIDKLMGDSDISIGAKIAEFSFMKIEENLSQLSKVYTCLQAEDALRNNDENEMELALNIPRDSNLKNVVCTSFYEFKKDAFDGHSICDFANKYDNSASRVLHQHCETHGLNSEM